MRFGTVALTEEEDPVGCCRPPDGTLTPKFIWELSRRQHAEVGREMARSVQTHDGGDAMGDGGAPLWAQLDGSDIGKGISSGAFRENYLLALIRGVCYRNGIRLTDECTRQLRANDGYALLGFEFVTADIVDIVPIVKHMHQVQYVCHHPLFHTSALFFSLLPCYFPRCVGV